jgi:hypothetical protein
MKISKFSDLLYFDDQYHLVNSHKYKRTLAGFWGADIDHPVPEDALGIPTLQTVSCTCQ